MTIRHGEKKGKTVSRIMEAAKDEFADKGFAGARVDEIARRAGVNKAALYYHIGDKDALYAAVIHGVIGMAAQRLAEDVGLTGTPEEKIKTYLRTLIKTFDENPQVPRIMMREMASGGKSLPGVFFQDLFSVLQILSGIIEEGKEKGVFADTFPLLLHFMAIGTTVIYKTVVPVLLASEYAPDEMKKIGSDASGAAAREIEKLILKAIGK